LRKLSLKEIAMIYKKNWNDFVKANYQEICNLAFYVTKHQCDIDFVHDCIVKIKEYKSLEKFDKDVSQIQTYIGKLLRFQWCNKIKTLYHKATHLDIQDFREYNQSEDEVLLRNLTIKDIDNLEVPDKIKSIMKYRLDGYTYEEIGTMSGVTKQAVRSYFVKYRSLIKSGYDI
jgi:RNA polymerase sigma factor (sigma-70 family)